jgi:hypothetical protein
LGLIAGVAVLLGLVVWEALRKRPSPELLARVEEPIVLRHLCRAVTLIYDPGIARGGPGEVVTGDPDFDRQFQVRGPEDVARALLDVETRGALLALLAGPIPVRDLVMMEGELYAHPPGRVAPGGLDQLERRVAALAAPLRMPADVARRLAETLLAERVAAARPLQLDALARHHPEHPATILAVREALPDRDPEMRLAAARALGPEGRDVLLALARDAEVDASVAARAIEAVGSAAAASDFCSVLSATLAAARGSAPDAPLARKEAALACIAALVRSGEPAAERVLIEALACDDHDVRADAAVALGVVGTVASVAPLRDLAERYGGSLRRAAQQAVAAIQSRVAGARGDVSLPEVEGGQVSLLAPGGEVSLPPAATKPSGD